MISPGLIFVQKAVLLGLFCGELLWEAYFRTGLLLEGILRLRFRGLTDTFGRAFSFFFFFFFFWGGGRGAYYQNFMICISQVVKYSSKLQ